MEAKNFKFITLTNDGYIEYTQNLINSLKKINLQSSIKIYCVGKKSYKHFTNQSLETVRLESSIFDKKNIFQSWRSKNFNKLMFIKLSIIHENLKTSDQVLYSDGDVVFLQNPLEKLKLETKSDIVAQFDFNPDKDVNTLCAGFMLVNSNQKTLDLFNPKNVPGELLDRHYYFDDQKYINERISELNYKFLDIKGYPNGAYFYKNFEKLSPKIIHFNYLVGEAKKIKMKEMGYWSS